MISPLLLSLSFSLLQAQAQRPGLVEIPAGNVIIGADEDTTHERIKESPIHAEIFAGEMPRQSARVDGFYLSPTPVTNEMYLEFVNATGAVPPPSWAVISKDQRQALIQLGKEEQGPGYKFDEEAQASWWKDHWQDENQEWVMPPSIAMEPVVFISYDEALAYCEWTGLRLPTELEWVRAARGDSENEYPFGMEFDRKRASCNTTLPAGLAFKRLPVGTFDNASPFGIYDMVGQIHEFTDTRATALEGFKSFRIEVVNAQEKKETIFPSPAWDQNKIILKGGCFENEPRFMRIDSRLPYDGSFAYKLIGFRVAASQTPLRDAAYLKSRNVRSGILGGPPGSALDFERTIGMEKFSMSNLEALAAKRAPHEDLVKAKHEAIVPEGYGVFGPHRAITMTPLRDAFAHHDHQAFSKVDRDVAKNGRFVPIGTLCTDVGFEDFNIAPGSYTMIYMPGLKKKVLEKMGAWIKGEDKPGSVEEGGEAEAIKDPIETSVDFSDLEIVPDRRYLLIADNKGVAVAAIPLVGVPVNKKESTIAHEMVYNGKTDMLNIKFRVAGHRGKAYGFSFNLKPIDAEGNSLASPDSWGPTK